MSFMAGWVGVLVAGCDPAAPPPNPDGPPALCAKRFGDGAGQDVRSLGVDAAGNFVITGENDGSIDFGGGTLPRGPFVAKFDPSCQHLWSKSFPRGFQGEFGPPEPGLWAPNMSVDPTGNVIVSACFFGPVDVGGGSLTDAGNGDMILLKLDTNGMHVWSKRFGDGSRCRPAAVSTDAAGDILLANSSIHESLDFGGGPVTEGFVVKFSASGAYLWNKAWGGARIAADAAGNSIVVGRFFGTVDFGGGPITSSAMGNLFAAKLGPDGAHVWSKAFSQTTALGNGSPVGLAVAPLGEIALAVVRLEIDGGGAYGAKLDAEGNPLQMEIIGGTGVRWISAVAIDDMSNVAVAGQFDGTFDYGNGAITNAYLTKIAADGSTAWGRGDGDGDPPRLRAISFDSAGNLIVAGGVRGTLDFGNGALTGDSEYGDVLIAKFAP